VENLKSKEDLILIIPNVNPHNLMEITSSEKGEIF